MIADSLPAVRYFSFAFFFQKKGELEAVTRSYPQLAAVITDVKLLAALTLR